jgi:hypothetical protein
MRPRGLSLVVAGALLLGGSPAAPAPDRDGGPYRVQLLYRTGSSLAPFRITIDASTDNNDGMWFTIELYKQRGRWTKRVENGGGFSTYVGFVQGPDTTTYGHPAAALGPRCLPTCTYPASFDGSRRFTVKPVATSRYYVVSAHAKVTVTAETKGWKVKDVASPGFRRVLGKQSDATGVSGPMGQYERFTSASAPGGRYGSAAFFAVPCDFEGYGTARIVARGANTSNYGYGPPRDLRCFHNSLDFVEFAHTPYETTWRLEGDVIGIGTFDTRIVVFDFPKP